MSKTVNVAILGQGRSGRNIHGHTLSKLAEKYTIVAVSDDLEERRVRAEKEYNCIAYADYRQILERNDVDLIVNALPNHLHVPVTEEFLQRGFHVLCEKPVAAKTVDLDRLIQVAEKRGKLLAVFQNSRFRPAFLQIRQVIDSGVLGDVVQVSLKMNSFQRRWDWQTMRAKMAGTMLNAGAHAVDQALLLMGTQEMPQVTCIMDRINSAGDAEDYVKLLLHKKGYPLIDVELSGCDKYPGPAFHIQGSLGGLQGSNAHLEWSYYKPEEAKQLSLQPSPISNQQGIPTYTNEELTWYTEEWTFTDEQQPNSYAYSFVYYYEMLYETLVHQAPLEVPLDEIRLQVAVIEEAHKQNTFQI